LFLQSYPQFALASRIFADWGIKFVEKPLFFFRKVLSHAIALRLYLLFPALYKWRWHELLFPALAKRF
jgi:hypothetical protein